MPSFKRVLLVLVLLALALLIVYWPSDDDQELDKPIPIPHAQVPRMAPVFPVETPSTEQPKEVETQAQPEPPSHSKETQDFLDLVERAESPEAIYQTPGRFVVANKVDDLWITQGDILVEAKNFVADVGDENSRLLRLSAPKYWENNTVPYRIDPSLDPAQVLAAIAIMNGQTNVKFVEFNGESDFVYFKRSQSERCSSNVGRIGGAQEIMVNLARCDMGGILHEMMHALGFGHEHSREDRDNYLTIHWDRIEPGLQNQYQKLSFDLPLSTLGAFDFDSVLLYGSEGLSGKGVTTMTKKDGSTFKANRAGFSRGDIAKVNALYPKD